MPSKSSVTKAYAINSRGVQYQTVSRNCGSNWVLKNGKPDLSAQNAHHFTNSVVKNYYTRPSYYPGNPSPQWPNDPAQASDNLATVIAGSTSIIDWNKAEQIALAKFNGRLRKGNASLGVTLASWKQSRDMIVSRLGNLSKRLDTVYSRLTKDKKLLRRIKRDKDPLASAFLEGEFGWAPLLQDISGALAVVAGDNLPPSWVRGHHRAYVDKVNDLGNPSSRVRESYQGSYSVTVAAACSVSNPNLWLLNKLGLINPATVLWDLVPWSFVVNMFVNVNAMISQVTAEVGLSLDKKSVTSSYKLTYGLAYWSETNLHGSSASSVDVKYRSRTVGSLPLVKWQVKVPELNWELAAIAASLVVQKFQKINRLISL